MSKAKRAWYYVDLDGAQQGPVDENTLKSEYRTGEIDGLSLLWRPGQKGGWLKLDDLVSLKARISQTAAPATPKAAVAPPPLASPQSVSRRKQPGHTLQPRAVAKPKGASPSSTSAKKGHRSALTFSQESQFDATRFAESKKAKEDQRMAKIREVEEQEAAAGDARAQQRKIEAAKMKAELATKRADTFFTELPAESMPNTQKMCCVNNRIAEKSNKKTKHTKEKENVSKDFGTHPLHPPTSPPLSPFSKAFTRAAQVIRNDSCTQSDCAQRNSHRLHAHR